MPSAAVVDIAYKFKKIIEILNIDEARLQHQLARHGIKRVRSSDWLSGNVQRIHGPYREKLFSFFLTVHSISLDGRFLSMERDEFDSYIKINRAQWRTSGQRLNPATPIESMTGPGDYGRLDEFCGCYQIIRPSTDDRSRYTLEAMEIEKINDPIRTYYKTLFYSHNQPKNDLIYEGITYSATRYYFSLMRREHEQAHGDGAFRCVSFYVGDGPGCGVMSILILRGLSDEGDGRSAVAIPALAIKDERGNSANVKLKDAFMAPIEKPKNANVVYRLNPDSNILIGQVTSRWYPKIFEFCDEIIEDMKNLAKSLRPRVGNGEDRSKIDYNEETYYPDDMIIRTVTKNGVETIRLADPDKWAELVQLL